MTEKRIQSEPKKNLTLADAHDQLLDFFDHNPEIAAFYPEIVQEIINKPISSTTPAAISLPESRVAPFAGLKNPIK